MTSFSEEMRRRRMPWLADALARRQARRRLSRRCLHVSLGADRRRGTPAPRRRRVDGDRDAARPRAARAGAEPGRLRRDVVLRPPLRPLWDRDRRRRADDRAHGDERGRVGLLGVPLHSPAFQFERTTRSATEIVEFVRSILPRRSLPARHRALPAHAGARGSRRAARCGERGPADAPPPGAQLLAEIREQPAALRRLLEHDGEYARAAQPRQRTAPGSCAWSGTARRTTPPPTASTRSASCPAGRRFATRSRSRSTTAPASTSAGRRSSRSPVRPDARRARVRRACPRRRSAHVGGHERAGLCPRLDGGGGAPARRGQRARGRGDEDLREPARRARPARGPRGGPRPRGRRRSGAPPTCSRSSCLLSSGASRRSRSRSRSSAACS